MAGRTHGSAYLTASGAVGRAGKPKMVYAAHIISTGGGGAVLTLKDNATGGTIYITGTGTVSTGVTFNFGEGFFFPTDCFCTIGANTTSVLVSYEEYAYSS